MRTRRRTYTSPTPPSLVPETLPIVQALAVSGTKRRQLQSCTAKAKGNRGSKKNKCKIGLWALIPLDLLLLILSRLGLKANIQASAVCKAWYEAAVSVRKLQPPPLLFHSQAYMPPLWLLELIPHPFRYLVSELKYPRLHCQQIASYSKDGWVLAIQEELYDVNTLLFNPFTQESFYLPTRSDLYCKDCNLAFSAAPTSASCMVITYYQPELCASVMINTWRPGETVWTAHWFENKLPCGTWEKCIFSNGMFYCLSTCGYLGGFDPSNATWNILPVKPSFAFSLSDYGNAVFMTEYGGDIFVIYTHDKNNPTMLKLNSERKEWEEKRDLGGLTIYTGLAASFVRAGLPTEHRNKIYSQHVDMAERYGMYYSLGDVKSSDPPPRNEVTHCLVWVEPPHNNVNL